MMNPKTKLTFASTNSSVGPSESPTKLSCFKSTTHGRFKMVDNNYIKLINGNNKTDLYNFTFSLPTKQSKPNRPRILVIPTKKAKKKKERIIHPIFFPRNKLIFNSRAESRAHPRKAMKFLCFLIVWATVANC